MVLECKQIAYAQTDFDTKFGVPRQSGRVDALTARIVFLPKYRNPDALRGIEGFSHLWLIWHFSEVEARDEFRPTVRPPRLGGNRVEGVFATRSPYRPNPIGLSCVKLLGVEHTEKEGDVLVVSGADLVNGTPILDIKPYLPFADARPDATGGFAAPLADYALNVVCDEGLLSRLPEDKRDALISVLREDPRPAYQNDPDRVYGFPFAGFEIKFSVAENTLTVLDIVKIRL
ncbi:MAG: tRNA (N6-threonylcarbamoyladenosine(37)-N6)-methyltransferase TrmO [Ruminococcaceae bacterium]|nr:tRNA (N6-threonylcarbamoyladenosine(37)-N6)-methyltransferase TrmO [Oscillospiraceae bacterium]